MATSTNSEVVHSTTARSGDLPGRAVRLLLTTELISAEEVVRHGVSGRDVSQSNGVALVEVGNGRGFAVKETSEHFDGTQGSSQTERRLYSAACARSDLARFLPKYFETASTRDLLVIEGLSTSRRVDRLAGGGQPDPSIAELIGTTLGDWHCGSASLDGIDNADPWMLHIVDDRRLAVLDTDDALRAVTDRIVQTPSLLQAIEAVRSAWHADVVIHGDMRFANVLVCTSPKAVRFVDWETSGFGDRRWDVAGIVQELLSVGLHEGHGLDSSSAREPAEAFLAAYRSTTRAPLPWSGLAPFVTCRLAMRAVQLTNWAGTTGQAADSTIDSHLDLAASLFETGSTGSHRRALVGPWST